jgi:hypothetical protein
MWKGVIKCVSLLIFNVYMICGDFEVWSNKYRTSDELASNNGRTTVEESLNKAYTGLIHSIHFKFFHEIPKKCQNVVSR